MCTLAIFPDDILELILRRLDSTACLIRASSTCKRWRRVVAGVGFLRCFRSVHGPPIAGTYHSIVRFIAHPMALPDFVPSPSSGINGRHFSLDFLLGTGDIFSNSFEWVLKDTRASLVLLERRRLAGRYQQEEYFVICEPLSQRYKVIPPLYSTPWDYRTEAFLLDGDDNSEGMPDGGGSGIGLSNFKVLCVASIIGGCKAGVFTSGGWRTISIHGQSNFTYFDLMGHCKGKIYWWIQEASMAVVVDRATADLASFVLQTRDGKGLYDHHRATVTTGPDGEARIVVSGHYCSDLKVFAARQGVALAGGSEWVLQKTIYLSAVATPIRQWQDSNWRFRDPAPAGSCQRKGTVFIEARGWLLALDLDSETMKIQPALKLGYPLELPWPPALRACRQPGTDLDDHDR